MNNYSVAVKEVADNIIFLEIIAGSADQSYGIEVAKLAGLPNKVIERSKEILKVLEKRIANQNYQNEVAATHNDHIIRNQHSLFNYRSKKSSN